MDLFKALITLICIVIIFAKENGHKSLEGIAERSNKENELYVLNLRDHHVVRNKITPLDIYDYQDNYEVSEAPNDHDKVNSIAPIDNSKKLKNKIHEQIIKEHHPNSLKDFTNEIISGKNQGNIPSYYFKDFKKKANKEHKQKTKKNKKIKPHINDMLPKKPLDYYSYVNPQVPDSSDEPVNNKYPDYSNYLDIYTKPKKLSASGVTNKKSYDNPDELDLFKAILNLLNVFSTYLNNDQSNLQIKEKDLKGDSKNYFENIDANSPRPGSYEVENDSLTDSSYYPDIYTEPNTPDYDGRVKEDPKKSGNKGITWYNVDGEALMKGSKKKESKGKHNKSKYRTHSYNKIQPKNYAEDYIDYETGRSVKPKYQKRMKETLDCILAMKCNPECFYVCA